MEALPPFLLPEAPEASSFALHRFRLRLFCCVGPSNPGQRAPGTCFQISILLFFHDLCQHLCDDSVCVVGFS